MNRQLDYVQTCRDAQQEQMQMLAWGPDWSPVPLLMFLAIAMGFPQTTFPWMMFVCMLVFSPPLMPYWSWFYLKLFFRNVQHRIQFDEEGIRVETLVNRQRQSSIKQFSWSELAAHGSLLEYAHSVQILVHSRSRSPKWQLTIPKRIFLDEQDLRRFLDELQSQLKRSQETSERLLFRIQYTCREAAPHPFPGWRKWTWVGYRLAALYVLIWTTFMMNHHPSSASSAAVGSLAGLILTAAVAGIFLAWPQSFWEKWGTRLFLSLRTTRAEVTSRQILIAQFPTQRIQWLFGHGSEFDLESFARTGALVETSEGFLLEYPRQQGRIPTRSCFLAKAGFSSHADADAFRHLIQQRLDQVHQVEATPQTVPL